MPPIPPAPGRAEQLQHAVAHIPFAPWCRLCIMAKGREAPHRSHARAEERMDMPTVFVDFCFKKGSGPDDVPDDDFATTLVMIDRSVLGLRRGRGGVALP